MVGGGVAVFGGTHHRPDDRKEEQKNSPGNCGQCQIKFRLGHLFSNTKEYTDQQKKGHWFSNLSFCLLNSSGVIIP